jgi:hypothetical protein
MEVINVRLNEPALFDGLVHGCDGIRSLPEGGDIQIVTKDGGMESGRAAAVISFTVDLNGELLRAQAAIPVRLLIATLRILHARYGDEGIART